MANYSLIADTGLSLIKVLREGLVPDLVPHLDGIGLAHPQDKGDMSVSLYLYDVKENMDVRNSEMIDQGDRLRYPPLALDLFYLITAHSSSDVLTRAIDEQRIIGKTMQLLHDHNILQDDDLVGVLKGSGESIRIVKEELQLDTLMGLFPGGPYKLSIGCRVGPVFLESTRTRPVSRVRERHFNLKGK
ncbi:DUF4255 domain-containing protein [Paenibacillus sp. 1P07SE]|uniref:DUF4255 domain-containing protein n=1 Tax=Paenibacillus sp. 1P07SE TaxID=3132209 RepID=UPI0039A70215